jgi:hypothetical protein
MDSTFIELSNDKIKNKHEVLVTIYKNNISNLEKKVSLDSFRLEEPIVHVYGNAAVVTFIMHTFRKKGDSLLERRTRFYDVWVKRGVQWKAVTWQASPIQERTFLPPQVAILPPSGLYLYTAISKASFTPEKFTVSL